MNISAPFIARPIATWLLAIAILLAGALGYRALPVSALPEVDFPTIQVTTQLPAGLRQGESGRRADPDPGAHLRHAADRHGQRRGGYLVAAETVRNRRRRPG